MSLDLENPIIKTAYIEALLNAKEFGGLPNTKAVIGKVMAKHPEARAEAKKVKELIENIISTEFPKSGEEIEETLQKIDPNALKEKEKIRKQKKAETEKSKSELVELPNAEIGKFVGRYAPDPSKYPHLGHAINYRINRMYADKYQGIVNLRFDDTNPKKVKPEYYEAIKEGLLWANAKWDNEYRASDHMEEFYTSARKLIRKELLYICNCDNETVKKNRNEGVECECRNKSTDVNLKEFEEMVAGKVKENMAVVRLRGDMKANNSVMRDPILFRILHAKHPLHERYYYLWPLYDYESAYMDFKLGTTHIIRSSEFGTMREELQSLLIEAFGGKKPTFFSYGRYNIVGCPTKGRVIRELVETGVVTGWDDIRLVTIQGLKKRGIQPEVITDLIREKGTTPRSTTIAWSDLVKFNRIHLTPKSRHFFAVRKPFVIYVQNAPKREVELPYIPENKKKGYRKIHTKDSFYIDFQDKSYFKPGNTIRLKDLYNITVKSVDEKSGIRICTYAESQEITAKIPKIQWVPTQTAKEGLLIVPDLLEPSKGKINKKSLKKVRFKGEHNLLSISQDEIVHLERIGFARLHIENQEIKGHLVHP